MQIVYIGNLNPDHFETAKLFLEHGKHVLLEKPLTMNAKRKDLTTQQIRTQKTDHFNLSNTQKRRPSPNWPEKRTFF